MDSASSKCSVCDTEFTEKKNLYRHLRKFHQIEPLESISKPVPKFECSVCAKHFSYLSSLLRHIRQNHLTDDEGDYLNIGAVRKIRILCPHKICNEEFMNYKKLREHLLEQHDVHVEYEELTFNSIAGFEEWKDEIQHSTMSLYTQDSAGYRLKNGSNRIFYNCHRSYSAKSKAKHIGAKSIVSNKIDKACPSRLEVTTTEIDGETLITVKYWKTHHGHDEQIGRITKKKKNKFEPQYGHNEQIEIIKIELDSQNNDNLISKAEYISSLVKTVSLSEEDSLAIEKQLDSLIESIDEAKLPDVNIKVNGKHTIDEQEENYTVKIPKFESL